MKEITHQVAIRDEEGAKLFMGSFIIRLPKRADRAVIQMEAMKAGKAVEGDTVDPTLYYALSEKIVNDFLVSLNIKHIPSGEMILVRDDLEYYNVEELIREIVELVIGGVKLGKKKGEKLNSK